MHYIASILKKNSQKILDAHASTRVVNSCLDARRSSHSTLDWST